MPARRELDETSIAQSYRDGASLTTLCARFGISAPTLYAILDRHGVPRKRPGTESIDRQAFCQDYVSMPMPLLVEKYGLSRPTLRALGATYGVQRAKALRHKQTKVSLSRQEEICAEYRGGKSIQQLSRKHGLSAGAVFNLLKRHGVKHTNVRFGRMEQEVRTWLEQLSGKSFQPNREILDGKELDMYNDSLKLAVEFCGLYWHTEDSPEPRKRNYHLDKLKKCREKGVRLITIFEDEWRDRCAQVQSFLRSVLGKNTRKLHGRKCDVRDLSLKKSAMFFDQYHIQGSNALSRHAAGLYHGNELVGVMSFGRHPRASNQLVLDRLCFKDDVSIAGGASKLFQYLCQVCLVQEVISWSDNRWSEGKVYSCLGFAQDAELPPDYSYVDFTKRTRVSKQSQKKSNTGCPASMTELEFANNAGMHRIWDCGKIRWRWVNKSSII